MDEILRYFQHLTAQQIRQLEALYQIYETWNQRINLISRKDFENFYTHHVLHSLAIAKTNLLADNSSVLDVGTGGGFPGIPLAILYPHAQFLLADSIGKKIAVVNEVIEALTLTNVRAIKERAENINERFDAVVSRAVTTLPEFVPWVKDKFTRNPHRAGILYLKGGDLTTEIKSLPYPTAEYAISDWFAEPYFETKKVVHVKI